MSNLAVQSMSLVEIESELDTAQQRVDQGKLRIEKDQWRIAELLWAARDHFATDKEFKLWVSEKTGYTFKTAHQFVITYERFKNHKMVGYNQKSEKPIPFSKLTPLASKNVPPRTVDNVVKKLTSEKPPTEKEVRQAARESKPSYSPPPPAYNPDFAVRSERRGKFVSQPYYLLDVTPETSTETIQILAKHWKGKYHPDKGGDPEIFNRIVEAEKSILADRGIS